MFVECGVGQVDMSLERRGFFPKGGGRLVLSVIPLPEGKYLPGFSLEVTFAQLCVHKGFLSI